LADKGRETFLFEARAKLYINNRLGQRPNGKRKCPARFLDLDVLVL